MLHELVAEHLDPAGEPDQVLVGIETERGPWVQALLAAGYVVYRDQPDAGGPLPGTAFDVGGEVRSPADAHLLAEIVRLDRAHHRPVAGDSEIAEHVKVAARAHQTMIWSRVRQVNALRSLLREYYPAALAAFGTDLASARRVGGAGRRTDPGAGPAAVPGPDRNPAPQGRSATQPRRHRGQDQDRAGLASS